MLCKSAQLYPFQTSLAYYGECWVLLKELFAENICWAVFCAERLLGGGPKTGTLTLSENMRWGGCAVLCRLRERTQGSGATKKLMCTTFSPPPPPFVLKSPQLCNTKTPRMYHNSLPHHNPPPPPEVPKSPQTA